MQNYLDDVQTKIKVNSPECSINSRVSVNSVVNGRFFVSLYIYRYFCISYTDHFLFIESDIYLYSVEDSNEKYLTVIRINCFS